MNGGRGNYIDERSCRYVREAISVRHQHVEMGTLAQLWTERPVSGVLQTLNVNRYDSPIRMSDHEINDFRVSKGNGHRVSQATQHGRDVEF